MTSFSSQALKLVALGALLALAPAAATAQGGGRAVVPGANPDWVEVNRTENGIGYVDRRSISRDSGMVRYMGRIHYASPQSDGASEILHRGEIDCARNTFRILGFDSLAADGRVVESFTNDRGQLPAEAINAGSPNERLHQEHCG